MSKLSFDQLQTQYSKMRVQLHEVEKREKRTYEALAALINYIKGIKKYDVKAYTDFFEFKKELLAAVTKLKVKQHKMSNREPKFNVKHYERAIKGASDATYRDMAIQAANKDLNHEAITELVTALHKDCREVTKQVKELMVELHKLERMKNDAVAIQPAVEFVEEVQI